MKNIAVILSGCGFKDGAAITEAVSTLIQLSGLGANYKVFAPNIDVESHDHRNDQSTGTRNILTESSRISRGDIEDLENLKADDFDAVVFPGGFGAALHLCDWAQKGASSTVLPQVEKLITQFYEQSKPIGAICIAPVLVAKILGKEGVTLTIGNDKETAQEVEKTGAVHEDCAVDDYVTDRATKVITTPAYMYGDAKPHEVFKGISGLCKELVEMA